MPVRFEQSYIFSYDAVFGQDSNLSPFRHRSDGVSLRVVVRTLRFSWENPNSSPTIDLKLG